jgi:hypothetical protein
MVILSLQWTAGLLRILFAAIALRVASRSLEVPPLHRACWLWTGVAFMVVGVVGTLQDAFGTWAFVAGRESMVWALYLQLAPAMNHSRSGVEIAMGCVLIALMIRGTAEGRFWRFAAAALLLGLAGGATLGLVEGELVREIHYPLIGIVTLLELLVLLAMLMATLLRGGMDWILWMILAFYALTQAFNSIWFVALAWIAVPDVWSPSTRAIHVYLLLVNVSMVVFGAFRLRRLRRGIPVPSLLEIGEGRGRLHSLG